MSRSEKFLNRVDEGEVPKVNMDNIMQQAMLKAANFVSTELKKFNINEHPLKIEHYFLSIIENDPSIMALLKKWTIEGD